MTKSKINRRGFLKIAGASAATSAVLTGCGPASRYVVREPYANMPEYTYNGESTYYATTCQECPAGCGIVVRTFQGRAIKIEGNPNHPVNAGKTCARGQAALQGLYNPDRVTSAVKQGRNSNLSDATMTWEESINILAETFQDTPPEQIQFLLGGSHDHLYDLVFELAKATNTPDPIRFDALTALSGCNSLMLAAEKYFGTKAMPNFDLGHADLILSFGANFLETWLSPVSFTRQYAQFRKGKDGKRGYMVHFEARMSQTAAVADEWVPIIPGTEAQAALALGRLIAENSGQLPEAYSNVDAAKMAEHAGVEIEQLIDIADKFIKSNAPLAIPGNQALGQMNGFANADAIFGLNSLAAASGKTSLISLVNDPALGSVAGVGSSIAEITTLIEKMKSGEVSALLIHGTNPLFDLPASFGFAKALENVEVVISFNSFPDETALASDYIFPDHTNLESWGYRNIPTGIDGKALSGLQPVVVPFFDTRSTLDVLLAAAQQAGGMFASALPYTDEVAFIQEKLSGLLGEENDLIRAGDIKTFNAQFQQYGGWWQTGTKSPGASLSEASVIESQGAKFQGEGQFHLHIFVSPTLGDKGANKPWLQETPDPTTTVMWNTWIEINPQTAEELGIHDDDIIRLVTPSGEIEAPAYLYPAIRPDTVAVPFGQGHTAYGRYAEDRGANPLTLLSATHNEAGDLVFATTKVKIEKTGEHHQLARLESRIGVYGFESEH